MVGIKRPFTPILEELKNQLRVDVYINDYNNSGSPTHAAVISKVIALPQITEIIENVFRKLNGNPLKENDII